MYENEPSERVIPEKEDLTALVGKLADDSDPIVCVPPTAAVGGVEEGFAGIAGAPLGIIGRYG
jgi:hypothetical protein